MNIKKSCCGYSIFLQQQNPNKDNNFIFFIFNSSDSDKKRHLTTDYFPEGYHFQWGGYYFSFMDFTHILMEFDIALDCFVATMQWFVQSIVNSLMYKFIILSIRCIICKCKLLYRNSLSL